MTQVYFIKTDSNTYAPSNKGFLIEAIDHHQYCSWSATPLLARTTFKVARKTDQETPSSYIKGIFKAFTMQQGSGQYGLWLYVRIQQEPF